MPSASYQPEVNQTFSIVASPVLEPDRKAVFPAEPTASGRHPPASDHLLQPGDTPTAFPYPQAVARDPVIDVWDEPARVGDAWHRQTQLLLGEKVFVLQAGAEWSQIVAVQQPSRKHPLGYPGWVRSRALVAGWPDAGLWLVVMVPRTSIYAQPAASTEPIEQAYLDTRLPVMAQSGGWVLAALPGGRTGWISSAALRLAPDLDDPLFSRVTRARKEDPEGFLKPSGSTPKAGLPETLFGTASQLTGAPYLWGGTTIAGFDCSGFVYRLFHAHGILLARDAQDQARLGKAIQPADLRPGDLLFYTNRPDGRISHVGFYAGNLQIIDAEIIEGLAQRTQAQVLASHQLVSAVRPAAEFSFPLAPTPAQKPPGSRGR